MVLVGTDGLTLSSGSNVCLADWTCELTDDESVTAGGFVPASQWQPAVAGAGHNKSTCFAFPALTPSFLLFLVLCPSFYFDL